MTPTVTSLHLHGPDVQSISLARDLPAPPERVEALVADLESFMRAAGFSTVEVDGDDLRLGKGFALAKIQLDLRIVDDPDTVLVYEQVDGIFESMRTEYVLEETADGSRLTATTEFALDVSIVGGFLDGTVIKRQRTKELQAQFDYLESELEG